MKLSPPSTLAPAGVALPAWLLLLCGWLLGRALLDVRRAPGPREPAGSPPSLQRATLSELRALPGLGARRAVDLARARWSCAPQELEPESVHGIGPKTAAALRGALHPQRAQASLGE